MDEESSYVGVADMKLKTEKQEGKQENKCKSYGDELDLKILRKTGRDK